MYYVTRALGEYNRDGRDNRRKASLRSHLARHTARALAIREQHSLVIIIDTRSRGAQSTWCAQCLRRYIYMRARANRHRATLSLIQYSIRSGISINDPYRHRVLTAHTGGDLRRA